MQRIRNIYTPTTVTTKAEDDRQRVIATGKQWRLAKVDNLGNNSKQTLSSLGVQIIGEEDLFYLVNVPDGWHRYCIGYENTIRNTGGEPVLKQFCKLSDAYSEVWIKQIEN